MSIAVLSNVNMDSLIKRLKKKYDVYQPSGYGNWFMELANEDSDCWTANHDAVFLILDGDQLLRNKSNMDEMQEEIDQVITFIKNAMIKHSSTYFFVSSIDIAPRQLREMKTYSQERKIESYYYKKLIDLNEKYNNFIIFDLKKLVEENGRKNFYSKKLWYYGGMRFTMQAEKEIDSEISYCMNALIGNRKKCLVVDLDNTLWGGVVGEVGLNGLELEGYGAGSRYQDFQKRIKDMQELGVMIAVVSKNNHADVEEVFQNHKEMILTENDFVASKVNWLPKHENIKQIASDLNIGLDSFVFIDDMQVERQTVISQLPEVIVPSFPEDTSELDDFVRDVFRRYFNMIKASTEDKQKTTMYKENTMRQQAMDVSSSYEEFLQSLQTKITIWEATDDDVPRIAQLTQKTNQFNVTTKRYSDKEIKDLIQTDTIDVYVGTVEDKYGDNGKVILLIVKKDNNQAKIDTFLMSCRVMGRHIEEQVLTAIEDKIYQQGIRHITAAYKPTKKNKPVESLFEKMGYILVNTDEYGTKYYEIQLTRESGTERKQYGELILH